MTTTEKIAIMQAYENGKTIQIFDEIAEKWVIDENPTWDWEHAKYRIQSTQFSTEKEIRGHVTVADKTYKRISYVKPIRYEYNGIGKKVYKYSCPVCYMLGNKHQVHDYETNCALCNVNLYWD